MKKQLFIRWLGAYGRAPSLAEAFRWELETAPAAGIEVCAEPVRAGERPKVANGRVGLIVRSKAVVRVFAGDVWSERTEDGRLVKTRRPVKTHGEAWCKPAYRAIVLRNAKRLSREALEAVLEAARTYALPVFVLGRDGRLVPFAAETVHPRWRGWTA